MYWFTGDEHYGHANIIEFCNRPFRDVHHMNKELILRHNEVVAHNDVVVHAGDFTLHGSARKAQEFIERLNGKHVFVRGSHDKWMDRSYHERWEKTIENQKVVVDHYAGRVWPKSHFNSWQLYGHSHGGLPPEGKQWDVGVDNNNFYPVSFEQIVQIMESCPDNLNYIKKGDRRR